MSQRYDFDSEQDGEWDGSVYPDSFEEDVARARLVAKHLRQRGEGDANARNAWDALARGKTIGRARNIQWDGTVGPLGFTSKQSPPLDLLELRGEDANVQQFSVTFAQPQIIVATAAQINAIAAVSGIDGAAGGQTPNAMFNTGNFPGLAAPIAWGPCYGIIEWGAGDLVNTAIVDILNGSQVNLVGSYVRARALIGGTQLRDGSSDGSVGGAATYRIGAFVGPATGRNRNAQCTLYMGSPAAGADTATKPVPPFAKSVSLISANRAGASQPINLSTAFIRFWAREDELPGLGQNNMGNLFFSSNNNQPQNIPNGAPYFSIQGGDGTSFVGACFDLAIS